MFIQKMLSACLFSGSEAYSSKGSEAYSSKGQTRRTDVVVFGTKDFKSLESLDSSDLGDRIEELKKENPCVPNWLLVVLAVTALVVGLALYGCGFGALLQTSHTATSIMALIMGGVFVIVGSFGLLGVHAKRGEEVESKEKEEDVPDAGVIYTNASPKEVMQTMDKILGDNEYVALTREDGSQDIYYKQEAKAVQHYHAESEKVFNAFISLLESSQCQLSQAEFKILPNEVCLFVSPEDAANYQDLLSGCYLSSRTETVVRDHDGTLFYVCKKETLEGYKNYLHTIGYAANKGLEDNQFVSIPLEDGSYKIYRKPPRGKAEFYTKADDERLLNDYSVMLIRQGYSPVKFYNGEVCQFVSEAQKDRYSALPGGHYLATDFYNQPVFVVREKDGQPFYVKNSSEATVAKSFKKYQAI